MTFISVTSVTFTNDFSDGIWHEVRWVRGQMAINITQGQSSLLLSTDFDPYIASVSPEINVYFGAKPFKTGKDKPDFFTSSQHYLYIKWSMQNIVQKSSLGYGLQPLYNITSGIENIICVN